MRDSRTTPTERSAIGRQLAAMDDPTPGKSGIVRDRALRDQVRVCLRQAGFDPDHFKASDIKKLVEAGSITHTSGVPIRSVVLLRTMSDPVIASRRVYGYATDQSRRLFDAQTGQGDFAAARAYVGGNNHHIEFRADDEGRWSGVVVSAFEAAQRKLAFFRVLRQANVPRFDQLKTLRPEDRSKYRPLIDAAATAHPIVDRSDCPENGGRFVMSLCEGEMVSMKNKKTGDVGYFVVAKLVKPSTVVLAPDWDARTATERKDAAGNKVPNSERDSFDATPSDFKTLGPPGHEHAVKVRVSPLGEVSLLLRD